MGRSATERSYLSIREVLDLLVGEFPDVTISKIRFLESRGLIHPERSPSGYRKFYEADVERLRWILRQQREHFLPLKVIKGRLEGGDLEASISTPSLFDQEPSGEDDVVPMGPFVPAGSAGDGDPPPAEPAESGGALATAETAGAAEGAGDPGRAGGGTTGTTVSSGAHLSLEELASAVAVEPAVVAELEEFGLVAGRDIAGVHCFDEEALVVARLAAGFRRFGLESRHLRTFMHAAEREAGLFAQVVTPLLRQRNPAARERAYRDLEELAQLGAALQEALVRAELRGVTGG